MGMDGPLVCDATNIGNNARFMNHHCNPNCVVEKRMVFGFPCLSPCLVIFAKRDVAAGEELTLDYKFITGRGAEPQPCRCGADDCRGVIGPRPKNKNQRNVAKQYRW